MLSELICQFLRSSRTGIAFPRHWQSGRHLITPRELGSMWCQSAHHRWLGPCCNPHWTRAVRSWLISSKVYYFFFPLKSYPICSTSCWIWDLKCGLCYVFTGDRLVKMKLRHFVDVRDVADALLLVYESPEASGRYICNSHARLVSDVIKLLKSWYPTYQYATK